MAAVNTELIRSLIASLAEAVSIVKDSEAISILLET
jgi:hypothetical protein